MTVQPFPGKQAGALVYFAESRRQCSGMNGARLMVPAMNPLEDHRWLAMNLHQKLTLGRSKRLRHGALCIMQMLTQSQEEGQLFGLVFFEHR
jgi:hypothetical protein